MNKPARKWRKIADALSICKTAAISARAHTPSMPPPFITLARLLLPALCAVVFLCLFAFLIQTRHWPLVGDAVSVHYLILLMEHGMAPYRQIVDAQMPGTYLIDWAVMHTFGGTAIGLRVFDYFLPAAAMVAMLAIAWPREHEKEEGAPHSAFYAAFLAGGLFALIHGRDGIPQAGQRDLVMAVLLLAAFACTFHAVRKQNAWLFGIAASLATTACTIKPTIAPAAYCGLILAILHLYRTRQAFARYLFPGVIGVAAPCTAAALFLAHFHAVPAFLEAVRTMWPYYATLQRRPLGFLVAHSYSPVEALVTIWIAIWVAMLVVTLSARKQMSPVRDGERLDGERPGWEQLALYCATALSLFSFLAQGKGFPYHRYPFLAFLLLIMMLDFTRALYQRVLAPRLLGAAGLVVAALVLAPISTAKILHFDWRNDDYYDQLSTDIDALGGASLSGHIQCLDAFSGCISTLYRKDLVQSTGFLVDFYFFQLNPNPVTTAMREHFRQDLEANPPRVFIVSKQVFPVIFNSAGEPQDTYDKLKQWPSFDAYLNQNYSLLKEQTWSRPVYWASHPDHPAGYRIYVRRWPLEPQR